jgi:hypothetical protein
LGKANSFFRKRSEGLEDSKQKLATRQKETELRAEAECYDNRPHQDLLPRIENSKWIRGVISQLANSAAGRKIARRQDHSAGGPPISESRR